MLKKLVLIVLATGVACNGDVLGAGSPSNPAAEQFAASLAVDISASSQTESGVYYRDLRVGTGDAAAPEDRVTVMYAGYLKDGRLFDNSSRPTELSLAGVVPGFRDGVVGMRPGGVRKIVIPSALGYGWEGRLAGSVRIPRNATLVFDVELFVVTKPTPTTP